MNKSGHAQQPQTYGPRKNRNNQQKGQQPPPRRARKREVKKVAKQIAADIENDPDKLMRKTIEQSR